MTRSVDAFYIFILSLSPFIEPRYGVLIFILKGFSLMFSLMMSLFSCFLLSIFLSFVLPLVDRLVLTLSQRSYPVFSNISKIYVRYVSRIRQRCQRLVNKYGVLGLVLFIAVPVPFTGMWSGAVAAYVLGFSRFRMFVSLLIGGILSVLVTLCLYFMGYACISTMSPSWSW